MYCEKIYFQYSSLFSTHRFFSFILLILFKMVICAAVGCSSETGKTKNISIFRLPRDKLLRKEWLHKLKRTNLPAEDNISICHLHFT